MVGAVFSSADYGNGLGGFGRRIVAIGVSIAVAVSFGIFQAAKIEIRASGGESRDEADDSVYYRFICGANFVGD